MTPKIEAVVENTDVCISFCNGEIYEVNYLSYVGVYEVSESFNATVKCKIRW